MNSLQKCIRSSWACRGLAFVVALATPAATSIASDVGDIQVFVSESGITAFLNNNTGVEVTGLRLHIDRNLAIPTIYGIGGYMNLVESTEETLTYEGVAVPCAALQLEWTGLSCPIRAAYWMLDGREVAEIDLEAPTARIVASATADVLRRNFSGTASLDPQGEEIVSYTWIWPDGTTMGGECVARTHDAFGTFSVRLYVTDASGNVGVAQQDYEIRPIAYPEVNPDLPQLIIAYAYGGSEIFIVNEDGTGNSFVIDGSNPQWSPDGTRISYIRTPGHYVYTVNPDGTDPQKVADVPVEFYNWGRNGRFTIVARNEDGVYVVNPDGSELQQVLTGEWCQARLSPDGTRLVARDGDRDLWVMDSDGTDWTQIPDASDRKNCGAWSPDGTEIAYHDGYAVRVFNDLTGTSRTVLTNADLGVFGFGYEVRWDRTGEQISITADVVYGTPSGTAGDLQPVVCAADGSGGNLVSVGTELARAFAWSSNSNSLLVAGASYNQPCQLYVIDLDSMGFAAIQPVGTSPGGALPSWELEPDN